MNCPQSWAQRLHIDEVSTLQLTIKQDAKHAVHALEQGTQPDLNAAFLQNCNTVVK